MKKVCVLIWVFFLLACPLRADAPNDFSAANWVDSTFHKLTLAERVGQLIDLRISPTNANLDTLVEIIVANQIGSVTITGGDASATVQLIGKLQQLTKVPVYVTAESGPSFNVPFASDVILPEPSTFALANDGELLADAIAVVSSFYSHMQINGVQFTPNSIMVSESGLSNETQISGHPTAFFKDVSAYYFQHRVNPNMDIYFNFHHGSGINIAHLESWSQQQWEKRFEFQHLDAAGLADRGAVLTIKSLPYLADVEAMNFNRKVIVPLIRKRMRFRGLLTADYEEVKQNQQSDSAHFSAPALLKIGADKILISGHADIVMQDVLAAYESRYLRRSDIVDRVKGVLRHKYYSGLSQRKANSVVHDDSMNELNSPALKLISYQVYNKAATIEYPPTEELPFRELANINFASVVLGYSELTTFQETLEKYAPFVHYRLPDAAFDPYVLSSLSEQLLNFDHVVVGIHTSGLISMDHSLLQFLQRLNDHTDVVLVFLGKKIDTRELEDFNYRISVNEDNFYTQQLAGQMVFNAGFRQNITGRLQYGIPEMQGMDSRSLEKIDEIVNEAIKMGATPGCQILVARNGAVLMEKGYGYYTYDSLMPVNSRSIYDLASITKVAATTPALMKLVEEGKIHLDSTLGAYLPELSGTNKSQLVIRDIMAHHSGLRAFYPFWKHTIEDQDISLNYYRNTPNDQYANTVAYGMFAAEELTDSLWNWTVNTRLRRKPRWEPKYDYQYSDLGFYLLQVLVERVSGKQLDTFADSVFYRPLGMSTLSFNPLCKFPLSRIVPTERDSEFRHVLVWGTVHDQIAAMKGGVSGHAGLFGNSHDLAKILQMQLQNGQYGGIRYFREETVKDFTSYYNGESRRGLGWDKPEREEAYSPASRYASHNSFGHRGFTGTIAWADPTFNLIFVFLSNRVYPDIANSKLGEFNIRERIHDVVYQSMWNFEKQYSSH